MCKFAHVKEPLAVENRKRVGCKAAARAKLKFLDLPWLTSRIVEASQIVLSNLNNIVHMIM